MKTLKTDFQNELIAYLESLKGKDGVESPAYFLEELRPKRVRRKDPNIQTNLLYRPSKESEPYDDKI